MMDTILTVQDDDLERLDAREAVLLFRDILWAEARRIGLTFDRIVVSTRVNVPDGGIDAEVAEVPSTVLSTIIRCGITSYQVKTGSSFSPWQPAEIRRELFGGKEPNRENLASHVGRCLDRDGTYILVCFGLDLTAEKRQLALDSLAESLKSSGYQQPKFDVWSINNLLGFLQMFPGLALRVNGRSKARFETHQDWATRADMQTEFNAGDAQLQTIVTIQTELRRDPPVHVRVWGEPGIGKTRLVLEATGADDLRPLVIYTAATTFRDSDLMTELLRGDLSAILVVDECDPNDMATIWNRFKYRPGFKLISIYTDRERVSDVVDCGVSPLDDDRISSIIQTYNIPQEIAGRWARDCGGSPRVAHVIGENLAQHPEDLLISPGTVNIWERYITGPDDPTSLEVRQRRLTLEYLSLFKRFGFGSMVEAEAKAIAGLIQMTDPQITWPAFVRTVTGLRKRRILQGETTLYITPRLLHIKLWLNWWDKYGEGFDLNQIIQLPPTLLEWFFEMFVYAAGSPVAGRVARELLSDQGPFRQNSELLNTPLGSRFFRFLAEAEPAAAAKCLAATIGSWNKTQLQQFGPGRRNIVWALERIAWWRELFAAAAELLFTLAENENESITNNASGVFVELFSITTHRDLSRTEASPAERFPVLREALQSASRKRRLLALRACEQALTLETGGVITDVHRVVGKVPDLWVPKTWGDVFSAYREVWQHLADNVDALGDEERQQAVKILLRCARELSQFRNLAGLVVSTIEALSQKPYVDQRDIIETVVQLLHYDGDALADEARRSWEELRDRLTGADFHSMLVRYVGMDLIEDKVNRDGKLANVTQPHFESLAQEALSQPERLRPELNWLVTEKAKQGYRFGYELGRMDSKLTLLSLIADAQKRAGKEASAFFLSGYLRVLFEVDPAKWEELIESFTEDSALRTWVPELTWRAGQLTDTSAVRILRQVEQKAVDYRQLGMFAYGGVLQGISESVFHKWINMLLAIPDQEASYIAIEMYLFYYFYGDSPRRAPEDLTFNLLTSPAFFTRSEGQRRRAMVDYHWRQVGRAFVGSYPNRGLELAQLMLRHFGEDGTIMSGFRSSVTVVLSDVAAKFPREVWDLVARELMLPVTSRGYHIAQWLRGDDWFETEHRGDALSLFPLDAVLSWVDEDIKGRAWHLATFVPPDLSREAGRICWPREVLARYGNREDVRRNLIANFSTEGWTGPRSVHLMAKRQRLLDFGQGESESNVRRWLDEYADQLEKEIEHSRIEEERRDF